MKIKRRKTVPQPTKRPMLQMMVLDCLNISIECLELSDFASLTGTCKSMQKLPSSIVERKFKQLYMIDFEPESVEHFFVSPAGDKTTWQKRYQRRFEVELNQKEGMAKLLSCDNVLYPLHVDMSWSTSPHFFADDWGLEIARTWHTCERLRFNGYLLVYEFAAPLAELDLYPVIARITVE